ERDDQGRGAGRPGQGGVRGLPGGRGRPRHRAGGARRRRRPPRRPGRGRSGGRRRLHPPRRRDGQPALLHRPRPARRGGHHGLRRAATGGAAGAPGRRPVGGGPHRPQLLDRGHLDDALRRDGRAVLRLGRGHRAAPPRQGRRAVGHRATHGAARRRRPARGRQRPDARRHQHLPRRGAWRRGRRRARARRAPAWARGPPGGPARRAGRDPHHPPRLPRPGVVHPRRPGRAARDRRPPGPDRRAGAPARPL
ncbi:MAG: 4-hydroxy-tetrahydrodipicolinate reductase, partial [uncultured Nocardioides sp.]